MLFGKRMTPMIRASGEYNSYMNIFFVSYITYINFDITYDLADPYC